MPIPTTATATDGRAPVPARVPARRGPQAARRRVARPDRRRVRRDPPVTHGGAALSGVVDRAMSVASVLHPLSAVPQVLQIYSTQDATGTSLLTWLFFMAVGVVFLSYSVVHGIRPLIVTQTLWFINDFLIVAGVLLYA